ncbi:hypothetical protein COCON_G00055990 [Conger conger]|uniref:Coiled-coil domain-containing protein 181 n=1 Tax=Conger conger TaxID=82655 RepID=A0A9Q1I619_CONCO|nr:hypothetical protein COCON_G00055990 [Conger conger]
MDEQKVKGQEQYEDDFEKDLDWLISEEGRSEGQQDPEDEDLEAQIDKELEEEERWPSPFDSATESDGDGASEPLPLAPPTPSPPPALAEPLPPTQADGEEPEEEEEEDKRYILEKIQQANQDLKAQATPDDSRRRRLQFKDALVDLVVPPVEFEQDGAPFRSGEEQHPAEEREVQSVISTTEVAGRMSELQISPREEAGDGGGRQGRVLVEKDGKFDLVSLRDVESRGLLPPLACSHGDGVPPATNLPFAPRPPPPGSRDRPGSARQAQRSTRRAGKRRAQSASNAAAHTTFALSSEQKLRQHRQQQKKERIRREEEDRRHEQEAQKREENEQAFRAWMQRKREQLQADRRVLEAQELERAIGRRETCDPQEAFKLWLKRKQQQQVQQRQLEQLRRLEEESCYYLHSQEESERAFKLWLKRKHAEKRLEMRVARERSRRLVVEARRARRAQDLLCSVSEAKTCFTDHHGYRY